MVLVLRLTGVVRLPQACEPPSFHTVNEVKDCVADWLTRLIAMRLLVGSDAKVSEAGGADSR